MRSSRFGITAAECRAYPVPMVPHLPSLKGCMVKTTFTNVLKSSRTCCALRTEFTAPVRGSRAPSVGAEMGGPCRKMCRWSGDRGGNGVDCKVLHRYAWLPYPASSFGREARAGETLDWGPK